MNLLEDFLLISNILTAVKNVHNFKKAHLISTRKARTNLTFYLKFFGNIFSFKSTSSVTSLCKKLRSDYLYQERRKGTQLLFVNWRINRVRCEKLDRSSNIRIKDVWFVNPDQKVLQTMFSFLSGPDHGTLLNTNLAHLT